MKLTKLDIENICKAMGETKFKDTFVHIKMKGIKAHIDDGTINDVIIVFNYSKNY